MSIKTIFKLHQLISDYDNEEAKKITQKVIRNYINYEIFGKFNLDLNMAGAPCIGDKMKKKFKYHNVNDNIFTYQFNMNDYNGTCTDKDWIYLIHDGIYKRLSGIIGGDSTVKLKDASNDINIIKMPYQLIIKNKLEVTIKIHLDELMNSIPEYESDSWSETDSEPDNGYILEEYMNRKKPKCKACGERVKYNDTKMYSRYMFCGSTDPLIGCCTCGYDFTESLMDRIQWFCSQECYHRAKMLRKKYGINSLEFNKLQRIDYESSKDLFLES